MKYILDLRHYQGLTCLCNKGHYSSLINQSFKLELKDTHPEKQVFEARYSISFPLKHQEIFNDPSNTDTQTSSPCKCKQTNLEIFLSNSNTDSKSPPPSFPDVDTVVHTHPKVSISLEIHCNLIVRLESDSDPTSPKDNRVIRQ